MRTALDTSVLLDVISAENQFSPFSKLALTHAWKAGPILVCDAAWAEIRACIENDKIFANAISKLSIHYDPIAENAARFAGELLRQYRNRMPSPRPRIVADFLIGAHALLQADALLTRDRGFYRDYFRGLKIIDPSHRA